MWQSRSSDPQWSPRCSGRGWGMRARFVCIPQCICVVAVVGLCDRRVGTAWRFTPVIHDDPDRRPIVVPSPSLGHRRFCVAGLARGLPDRGGAAIMGVPLHHLVLPLSGCVSRRTPTRATRGEARGHRSVLAQNSLLMYPLLFPFFGLVVDLVCPHHMVD